MKDFKIIIFVLLIIIFMVQMYFSQQGKKSPSQIQKPTVALSTFSLYDIAKNISQNTLNTVMILPFGVDAHGFEPTPKLMAKILQSDLVIYSGAGLEPWTKSIEFK